MTFRFLVQRLGKDVTGIIFRYVYNDKWATVNREFGSIQKASNDSADGYCSMKYHGRWFGFCFRRPECGDLICNWKTGHVVSDLPKHYWHVKELY